MLKVIFLDMDGVINNTTHPLICLPMRRKDNIISQSTLWGANNIAPFLKLMKWCYEEDIQIVISSTWRLTMTKELFEEYFNLYFERNNLPKIHGCTNVCLQSFMHRGIEIREYVIKHNIQQYLCIDDDTLDILQEIPKDYVYETNPDTGLLDYDVNKIKKIWKKKFK